MRVQELLNPRNIIIAVVSLVLIFATFGLILFFIDRKKKANRF
jgi:hypothetical protein